jgi:hypothetical protein
MINGATLIFNRFVVMSTEEKIFFESSSRKYDKGLGYSSEIYPCKNSIYTKYFKELQGGEPPEKIVKTMVIGTPINEDLPLSWMMNYMYLELLLVSTLLKNGYHVTFKTHPDTSIDIGTFFDSSKCERATGIFEDEWPLCDCIIFPQTVTTTFGYSLMTPKHVIAFNWPDCSAWRPELLNSLNKRISLINVGFNHDGRPVFDIGILLDSLSKPKAFDYSVAHEFALK